jgi:hypothetical protein
MSTQEIQKLVLDVYRDVENAAPEKTGDKRSHGVGSQSELSKPSELSNKAGNEDLNQISDGKIAASNLAKYLNAANKNTLQRGHGFSEDSFSTMPTI